MGWSEHECDEVLESVKTLGSLSNYHPYLHNIHPLVEPYDDTAVDRFSNPNAGAVSYHQGHKFSASRDIDAGEEVFAGKTGNALLYYSIMHTSFEMNHFLTLLFDNLITQIMERIGSILEKALLQIPFQDMKTSRKLARHCT